MLEPDAELEGALFLGVRRLLGHGLRPAEKCFVTIVIFKKLLCAITQVYITLARPPPPAPSCAPRSATLGDPRRGERAEGKGAPRRSRAPERGKINKTHF